MKGADLHLKGHSIQLFTDASNEGWGTHLEQASTKGLWSGQTGKKATHKCSRAEGGFSGHSKFQEPVPKPNSVGCHGQLNSSSLHKQTHSRVSECGGRPSVQVEPSSVNRMVTGVQRDLSKVVHSSCISICHSSEPQSSTIRIFSPRPKCLGHRCSEHKLVGSHCLCLPSHGSPSQGDPKNQQTSCLIIVIAPGWPGMPWFWDLVQLSTEIPLQLPVSKILLKQSHNYVFHSNPQPPHLVSRSGQLEEQDFSVEVKERIAAPQRSATSTIYKSKWALFEKWCRENSVDFSTPSVKQVSDFFMYLYQDLNRHPFYH